jgi:hypothetical protein
MVAASFPLKNILFNTDANILADAFLISVFKAETASISQNDFIKLAVCFSSRSH